MRASLPEREPIRVAVIESDPLRFVGLRACLGSESDFELSSTSLSEASTQQNIDNGNVITTSNVSVLKY